MFTKSEAEPTIHPSILTAAPEACHLLLTEPCTSAAGGSCSWRLGSVPRAFPGIHGFTLRGPSRIPGQGASREIARAIPGLCSAMWRDILGFVVVQGFCNGPPVCAFFKRIWSMGPCFVVVVLIGALYDGFI